MTRGAKMFMVANNRSRSNRDGNRDGNMNYKMQNNYGMESNQGDRRMENEMRGGYGMEANYTAESRFRDRRGREHYDNGRFAPMRNQMGYDEPWSGGERSYDIEINRYENGGRGTRGDSEMRMIGFDRAENEMRMGSDASLPYYREMDRMQGNKAAKGGASSHSAPMFDEHMAREWTSMMENEDGTKGPHWTIDQTKKVMEQRGLRCDPYEFWAVINSIYSDDVAVAKKHGVNKMDYYVDRAIAWLEDKDAQDDKAGRYFEFIVKH